MENDENNNIDEGFDIDEEIKELSNELNSHENKTKELKEEEILYRLIFLYKIKKNTQQEKSYIELCIKKDIILSEEIWLDYINIKIDGKKSNFVDIISIYLKALDDFIYPKIIQELFSFILVCDEIIQYNKYDNYFNKYLSKGIYSPEYSVQIFDLYYKFNKLIFEEQKKDKKDFEKYLKNKLNKECHLSEIEIEQILSNYKECKNNMDEQILFIFNNQDNNDDNNDENEEEIKNNIIQKINEFNSQFNLLFNESFENCNLIVEHLESNLNLLLKVNENYIIYYYEKALSKYVNNSNLWSNYLYILDNINSNIQTSKLEKIKLACKCCKKNGDFIIEYLYELEKNNFKDLPNIFNNLIKDENYSKKIEDIYIFYLQYKIRNYKNINNEETKSIRDLFQKCLSSIQNYNINEFTKKILHMWAEFEVYKTNDKNMFFNLMQKICINLDKSINSFRAFIYYAKSFPNNEIQIRNVYKLAYDNLEEEDRIKIYDSWLQWELFFGDINTIKELKQLSNSFISNKSNIINIFNQSKISEENKQVFIKGISHDITEEELKEYINKKAPLIKYKNMRLVLDLNGKNKGFAFVDFESQNEAKKFIDIMNDNNDNSINLKNSELICAFCLSPKSGKNDKRTLFINNLPFDVEKEDIRNTFSDYGKILDIRIIYNPHTQKPRGYGYVEFEEENSVDKIINSDKTFEINGRKIMVSKSISVEKLRNAVKYVVHISNLNFKVKEKDIEELISKEIDKDKDLKKIFLCKDEQGKFKGYGFIEFNNKESFDKILQLNGKVFKGRNLVIKESTRNITEKSENNKQFINKKRKKDKTYDDSDVSENKIEKNNEKGKNKKKMNNSDFKNLFS